MFIFNRNGRPLAVPAWTPTGAAGGFERVGVLSGFVPHPRGNYDSLPLGTSGQLGYRSSDRQPFGSGINVTTLTPAALVRLSPWIRTGASLYTMRPAPGISGAGIPPGQGISYRGAWSSSPPTIAALQQPRSQPVWPNRLAGAFNGTMRRGGN